MERREFLKRLGIGAAATSAVVAACTGRKEITSSSTRKATGLSPREYIDKS